MASADFYVIEDVSEQARRKLVCRLAEQAYAGGQRALIFSRDEAELQALDDLLWTFADGSFVPHERLAANDESPAAPICLASHAPPAVGRELLINLDAQVPPFAQQFARVLEVLDGDPARRQAGRLRFRHYQSQGVEPRTHKVGVAG
jgi:DNA polymerase-3 subunit chi